MRKKVYTTPVFHMLDIFVSLNVKEWPAQHKNMQSCIKKTRFQRFTKKEK